MNYLTPELIAFYITITANICFAGLFVYHFTKAESNKSLMILAGCLCVAVAFGHFLSSYKNGLDKSSLTYYNLVVNWYLIHLSSNALVISLVYWFHRHFKVPMHYIVRYVFRAVSLSIVLNLAMHVDIMVLGNRDTQWLYTAYSYGENLVIVFLFASVMVARKWSEVFKWLQLAHSR